MRAGRGSSDALEKWMFGWRSVGREPGRFASSIVVASLRSAAVGSLGWLMAF